MFTNDAKGMTLIELVVVIAILGVLVTLLVTELTGQRSKNNLETSIKQLYSDLSEMRVDAMSQKKAFGVFLNNAGASANFLFTTYGLYSDAGNPVSVIATSTLIRTTTLLPLAPLKAAGYNSGIWNGITDITFDNKGFLSTPTNSAPIEIYASCPNCDSSSVSNCNDQYLSTICGSNAATNCCRAADMSTGCSDTSYPEFSCLVVTTTSIKTGKWCDLNTNGVYDSGECIFK
ncbi:MAG: type II secretion system protein [Nitrospirae bacterium]|nr:type II secretion system protein [Nitrospirota bacterium]